MRQSISLVLAVFILVGAWVDVLVGAELAESPSGKFGVNNDPVLDPVGNRTVDEGETLAFTLTSSDVDGDPPQYSMTGAPADATLNTTTGAFSWTPGWDEGGNVYNVTFTVEDDCTGSDSEAITITVNEVDGDFDGDGLDDSDELAGPDGWAPTDPLDADSDDDGWSDGDEVTEGTDPNDANDLPSGEILPWLGNGTNDVNDFLSSGGGCSAGGTGCTRGWSIPLLALAGALMLLRRRRRHPICCT